jgi:phosphopantetheinyl transferase (holo-ACP synthase)
MLGNDVVDLGDAECASRHRRFDARVFRVAEREVLARSADPGRVRQILWAAKESAYKALRRVDPRAVFSPRRFEVELEDSLAGRVRHPSGELRVRVTLDGDCVHAVATSGDTASLLMGAAEAGDDPSAAVRSFAISRLSGHLGVDPCELTVERVGRLPQLRVRGRERAGVLSLSHHGRFVAFACTDPQLRRILH